MTSVILDLLYAELPPDFRSTFKLYLNRDLQSGVQEPPKPESHGGVCLKHSSGHASRHSDSVA